MKKIYLEPELEVVKIETSGSLLVPMSDTTDTADHSLAPENREELEIFLFQLMGL